MMSCKGCKHYVTVICTDCLCFDNYEGENGVVYTIKSNDNINSPSHYANRQYETIEVIEDWTKANKLDGYQGYLYGNVIKYISRLTCKGDALDNAKKAQWYLNRLIEVRENEKVHSKI